MAEYIPNEADLAEVAKNQTAAVDAHIRHDRYHEAENTALDLITTLQQIQRLKFTGENV